MIQAISVLNTLQDNALDAFVDANGFLNVTGLPQVKASSAQLNRINPVSAVASVKTVTFTAQASSDYYILVTGYDDSNNLVSVPFFYTSAASGETATTIANAFATLINKSGIASKFASVVGGATLVITSTSANPLGNVTNPNSNANISIANTTQGVEAQGLGSDLLVAYGGFSGSSDIVPTASYTQWEINLTPKLEYQGFSTTELGLTTLVVLINNAATSSGLCSAAFNLALLQAADDFGVTKSIGTLTGLALNQRVIVQSPATTTAAITVTTGAIALSGGAATLSTLGVKQGDVIVVSVTGTTAFTTSARTTVIGITSATAATGDNITAVSAAVFKTIGIRNIPN